MLSTLIVSVLAGCGDDSQMAAYQQRRATQIAAAQRANGVVQTDEATSDEVASGDTAAGEQADGETVAAGVVVPVLALDNSFRPEVTEVEVGDEVLWENRGQNNHDILYVEGDDFGIELADFGPGVVYSHIFTEPGEYRYYCTVHGNDRVGMIGTIIVT